MHHLRYDMAVLFAVAQGKRPHRPAAWRDTHEEVLWLLAERCWDADPKKREKLIDALLARPGLTAGRRWWGRATP